MKRVMLAQHWLTVVLTAGFKAILWLPQAHLQVFQRKDNGGIISCSSVIVSSLACLWREYSSCIVSFFHSLACLCAFIDTMPASGYKV